MGILCVFCVYDTIGNRCFEKTSFPKIVPDMQRYAFFKYKTEFLAIQFICDRRIQCGTKHVGNSVFYM